MPNRDTLLFRRPATRWTDALPAGNGHIGAMLYGSICDDLILLNHEAVYRPQKKSDIPSVSDALPELRKLLFEGRWSDASKLYPDLLSRRGTVVYGAAYHPVCDLRIRSHADGPFSRYRRGIDLDTGLVWSRWRIGDVAYSRELFVSRADGIVVVRLKADRPGSVSVRTGLIPPPSEPETESAPRDVAADANYTMDYEDGLCTCNGVFVDSESGIFPFGAAARFVVTGDRSDTRIDSDQLCIEITDADEVLILIDVYAGHSFGSATLARGLGEIKSGWDELFRRHVDIHKSLYERSTVEISAEADVSTEVPMEDLLSRAFDGEVADRLIMSMYRFGRYLAICSNGTDGWPANLQGIWNGAYFPPWQSDFHNDENIQMNYWAVLPGALPELMKPLFEYYTRFLDDYRDNARKLYGCRGIFLPIAQTVRGELYPSIWSYWTAGAGWLAQHFYDYYLFTGDEEFLRETVVPWLVETAEFYEDFLIEGEDGTFLFAPSLSPENHPAIEGGELLTINATMDVAVCREVLENLISACRITGLHVERITRWEDILSRLPAYEINADGAFREWLYPGLEDNYHHRHESHIYPLFPGFSIIREEQPDLFDACRTAIEKRLVIGLSSQTGWSFAHMANVWARFGEGDKALEVLGHLTRACTGANLFTYHNDYRAMGLTLGGLRSKPLFQIDANFGITAAVLEMLVFSRPGLIKLLPALPGKWRTGRIGTVLCRGGVSVDLSWNLDAKTILCTLEASKSGSLVIGLPWAPVTVTARSVSGHRVEVREHAYGESYFELSLDSGDPVELEVGL